MFNPPIFFRHLAHNINTSIGRDKAMMATEEFKVQVIAVVKLAECVLVQLTKVISLAKGIVGELPVELHINSLRTQKLMLVHDKRTELIIQLSPQHLPNIQMAIDPGMHPQHAMTLNRWQFKQTATRLVDDTKVLLVRDRNKITGIGIAPVMERTHKY